MIKLRKINKVYGNKIILKDFDLNIKENEITTILGPSGCGKTTLLRIISSLDDDYQGQVVGIDPNKLSFIFQEPRLLNWMTVYDNIAFVSKDKETIEEALSLVELDDERNVLPRNLSGGMKQRVSIARAFSYPSSVLLMDEGFSGLDLKIKMDLIKYFLKLWEHVKKTVIFITHDIDEALLISDRVIQFSKAPISVMRDIRLETPKEDRLSQPYIINIKKELIESII